MRTAVAALLAGLALLGCGGAGEARPELQHVLDEVVASGVAPGAAAYVAGPEGEWSGAAGLADVDAGTPMPPDARVRLESVTKIFVAALVLDLAEDGKLALDDQVERHVPGLLPWGERITLRQLLNHTSGLFDTNDLDEATQREVVREIDDPALLREFGRVVRAVERDPAYEFSSDLWIRLAATQPLAFEPGRGWHYSNIGFDVLGRVAEAAGGAPLATLVRERIARPLGLERTAYDPRADVAGPVVRGYAVADDGTLEDATRWTRGLGADGGVVSDAAETAAFLRALMRGELVGREWVAELQEPAPAAGTYGLGIGVSPTGCAGMAYGHNGAGDGYRTAVWVSGDGSRVAVLLLNGRGARTDDAAVEALRQLYCAA